MSKVAYIDNSTLLGKCHIQRSYENLREIVLNHSDDYTFSFVNNGELFGFSIKQNEPLTKLYSFPCWVVKFIFSSVETLHSAEQEKLLCELVGNLKEKIENQKGYYNLRVPTHIVDLIKAINMGFKDIIICGGTVEEIHMGNLLQPAIKDGMSLFFADEEFVIENKRELQLMAYKSFEKYQGQYHISPVTSGKAGEIYSDWIANSLNDYHENSILIAQYNGETVGYCTIAENEDAVDAILSSVNEEKRGIGTYKAMISTLIKYAKDQNKMFVTSTQFDNYIVQGTWNSLGLRPFYSIYNLHLDYRN